MKFPYGINHFETIATENYFYQDRTDRIPLVEETGKNLLFIRPRRFGKSLWLSTLQHYYDIAFRDRFAEIGHRRRTRQVAVHHRRFSGRHDGHHIRL